MTVFETARPKAANIGKLRVDRNVCFCWKNAGGMLQEAAKLNLA